MSVGNMYIGGASIDGMYLGSQEVDAMYIGDQKVFPTADFTVLKYKAPAQVVPHVPYSDTAWTLTLLSDEYDSGTTVGRITFSGTGLTIPYEAFKGCTAMTEFTIGKGVTSIGEYGFSECSGLTSVTINSGVNFIDDEAFEWCEGLGSITIPRSVTGMGINVFYACSALTEAHIPDSVVGPAGYHLDGCFQFCKSLSAVTLPSGMTTIGGAMFRNCTSLTSVTIPNGVTVIDEEAFVGTSAMTSVTIPSGVTTIGREAFHNNGIRGGLSEIHFTGDIPPATVGTNAFQNVQTGGTLYCSSQAESAYTAWLTAQTGNITTWTVRAGGLPNVPFMFNYNAKQFNGTTQTFPKTQGQLFNQDLVLSGDTLNYDANTVDFRGKVAYMWVDNPSVDDNPFNRYSSATTFTMVYRVKYFNDANSNLFANRYGTYNYMVRGSIFHTADSNYLFMEPTGDTSYIMLVRVKSDGSAERTVLNDSGTVLQAVTASTINWGNPTTGFSFFTDAAYGASETFNAVFYWMYLSNEELTDSQVLEVIRYNNDL